MEEIYGLEQLIQACHLLRLTNSNYSPSDRNGFSDNDDDPLGRPEITVKINDDWTVSPERKNLHTVECEPEDTDEEEDETEVYTLDDNVVESFIGDVVSSSQREASSDEDEQIVPSSPKIRKLSVGKELTLSAESVVSEEGRKCEEHAGEVHETKEEEEGDTSDKESRKRSNVEEEIGNRSKPQPP